MKNFRQATALLATLVFVSACGSSKSPSTKTAKSAKTVSSTETVTKTAAAPKPDISAKLDKPAASPKKTETETEKVELAPAKKDDAPPVVQAPELFDAEIRYQGPYLNVPNRVYTWPDAFQGQVFKNTFLVENAGDKPVKILEIKPKCGCTESSDAIKNFVLPPGKAVHVTLEVNTQGFTEYTQKDSDIVVEGQVEGDLKLWMRGEVKPLFLRSPDKPVLEVVRDVEAAKVATCPITLSVTKGLEGVKLLGVSSEKSLVKATHTVVRPGEKFRLELAPNIDLSDKTVGHSDEIFVTTQVGDKELKVQFPVTIQVRDRVRVLPAKSAFFAPNVTKSLADASAALPTKSLEIKSLAGSSHRFHIKSLRVGLESDPGKHFEAKLTTVTEGRDYKLDVSMKRFEPGSVTGRTVREKIHLTTDDPEVPTIVIPCTARLHSSLLGQ